MVDEAVAATREPGMISRFVRDVTGGTTDAEVAVRVSYSRPAIRKLVKRVRAGVDRDPEDARIGGSRHRGRGDLYSLDSDLGLFHLVGRKRVAGPTDWLHP